MTMELVIRVTVLCVVGALLTLILRRGTPEQALLLTLAVVVLILLSLRESVSELTGFLRELGKESGVSTELFVPLYKTVGIAVVVRAGGGLCRDAGESALAGIMETAGAICALVVILPLFRTVLSVLMELIQA